MLPKLIVLCLCALATVHGKTESSNFTGTYLIIAPRTIRPALPYSVSVNILDNSPPVVVDLSIIDEQNKSVAHTQGVSGRDFKPGQAQTVSFDALPLTLNAETQYRLKAVGKHAQSGKILFDQEHALQAEAKSRSIFVQTDKAIYKPGATVHFRVLAITPDLKPYKGKATIKITDPNENVIRQFLNQSFDGGVVGKKDALAMALSEEPPLGDWQIEVDVDGQKTQKSFTVDKYVLPKFDVSVQPPPFIGLKDDIEVNVTAKYTYGKGVVGKVALVTSIPYYYFPQEHHDYEIGKPWTPPSDRKFTKTVDLDKSGITKLRITRAELIENKLNITDRDSYSVSFTAAVTEKFSGTQRNASGSVTAYKEIYRVESKKQVDTFKPGLDYNITITVVTQDSKPLAANADRSLFVTVFYQIPYEVTTTTSTTTTTTTTTTTASLTTSDPNATTTMMIHPFPDYQNFGPVFSTNEISEPQKKYQLDADGTFVLTLNPPLNASSMRLEVHYGKNDSAVSTSEYAEASKSPTDSYLQLLAKSTSVTAGDSIAFKVRTTAPISSVTVQILSKGYIVLTKQLKLTGESGDISIPTTSDMSPKSRIIAYAIRPDNKEILVDAMDFNVGGMFKNNVTISVDPARVEPNQTVTFHVKSAPSSYVGLLSVDQSVLLLKSGNDITNDMIESDIGSYGSGGYYYGGFGFGLRRKRMIWCRFCYWNIGGQDAASVFENSGVVVFTDAYLYKKPPPPIMAFSGGFQNGGPLLGATLGNLEASKADSAKPQSLSQTSHSVGDYGAGLGGPLAASSLPAPGPKGPPSDESGVEEVGSNDDQAKKPDSAAPEPTVRKNFPETWVWADVVASADGTVTYKANAPDTITSWITSAFAISEDAGVGVAPEPAKLEVFRPFFIRVDLPYSIKRGEKMAIPVIAFNYLETDQKVTVTLSHDNSTGFDFVEKPGLVKQPNKQWNTRVMTVPGSGGSAVTYFPIVPTIVGEIKLLIKAIGDTGSDAVEMPLLVEPEGYPVYRTSPFVLELTKGTNHLSKSVTLDIPKDIVPGSPRAEFTVNGDIMAPVLNNIDQLVQMPYGCGEQNMLTFVPDIVVTQYLKTTQRLTSALEEKAKRFMEAGYQRELTYQRDDSSYSAFGKSDTNGSTWLTAFVTRAFKQAKPFIFVDDKKLKSSIAFMKTQQKENGVFEEHGMIHHKAMQGGASQGGVALTAYVLLSFLENDEPNPSALNFLERNLDRIKNDSYSLSIVTYALHLAKSSKKDDAWKSLQNLVIDKDGTKHWEYTVNDNEDMKEPSWWEAPRPVDVEATAYVLLSYVARGETAAALPLVRWLASKRNAFGGYSSTQDTVVALQALSAYASNVYSKSTDVSVTVTNGAAKQTFKLDPTNAIVLQSTFMKNLDKPIAIEASGSGIAYAQVNYHYNMPKRNDPQPFVCTKNVSQIWYGDMLINLCCKYALTGRSNMVVVQANALSGYVIEEYELNKLTKIKDLQRVELEKSNTVANIYINSLGSEPMCFNFTASRSFSVAEQKPALIVVYDYYDPGRRIEFDYLTTKPVTMEEVCSDGVDCWPSDEAAAAPAAGTSAKPSASSPPATSSSPAKAN